MSNFGKHSIPIFEDDKEIVKEYLKIALNILFFHRFLNDNNYCEEKSKLIRNISYFKLKNAKLEKEINKLLKEIDDRATNNKKFQITLNIYTEEKYNFFLYRRKEGLWEKWNFLVTISDNIKSEDKESKIRKKIESLLKELNSEKDFMPDLNLNELEKANTNNNNNNENELNPIFPIEIQVFDEFEPESLLSIIQNLNIKDSFNKII